MGHCFTAWTTERVALLIKNDFPGRTVGHGSTAMVTVGGGSRRRRAWGQVMDRQRVSLAPVSYAARCQANTLVAGELRFADQTPLGLVLTGMELQVPAVAEVVRGLPAIVPFAHVFQYQSEIAVVLSRKDQIQKQLLGAYVAIKLDDQVAGQRVDA